MASPGPKREMEDSIVSKLVCDFVATFFALVTFIVYSVVPEGNNLQGSLLRRCLATSLGCSVSLFLLNVVSEYQEIIQIHSKLLFVSLAGVSGNSFIQIILFSIVDWTLCDTHTRTYPKFVNNFSYYVGGILLCQHPLAERDQLWHLAKVPVSRILYSTFFIYKFLCTKYCSFFQERCHPG